MEVLTQRINVIRLVGLTSKSFVHDAYVSNPTLHFESALEQQKYFFENDSVFNDYFDIRMRDLGFECQSIVHDVPQIRDAWMHTSEVESSGDANFDFLATVLRRFRANVLFEQSAGILNEQMVLKIKTLFPTLAVVAAHIASPVNFEDYSAHDLVFVGCEAYVNPMRRVGCENVYLLRHGFDTRLESKLRSPNREIDVSFVGNSGYKNMAYWSRYKYLDRLSRDGLLQSWSKPNLESKECKRGVRWFAEQSMVGVVLFNCAKVIVGLASHLFLRSIGGSRVSRLFGNSLESRLIKYSNDYRLSRGVSFPFAWRFPHVPFYLREVVGTNSQVFGSEMLRVLSSSKITFHRRADSVDGCAGAMRLFEATGMGAMLLTDEDSDIRQVFEPGVEIVTYSSYEDCVEKIRYYLKHEKERELIAAKGQERTFRDHSLNARYSFIAEKILEQFLND